MSKFDHFNLIGPNYDRIFGRSQRKTIVDLAEAEKGQVLLDVGGGTGRVAIHFKDIVAKIFIADSSSSMLQEAQSKGLSAINTQSEYLPFEDSQFDRIIMVDALHHVANQQQTLDEMWRVLKPGGRMIVEEPDIRNFVVKLIAVGEKLLLMRSHFLSPGKIAQMVDYGKVSDVQVHREQGNAWIIIKKSTSSERS